MSRNVHTHSSSSASGSSASAEVDDSGERQSGVEQEHVAAAIKKLVGKGAESLKAVSQPNMSMPASAFSASSEGVSAPPPSPPSPPAQAEQASAPPEPTFKEDKEMETLSTLSRHMDDVPDKFNFEDLDAMSKDESLPADLRQAYADLRDNPELQARLDNLDNHGFGWRFTEDDHKASHGDLRAAFNDPELQAYNQQKAEAYAQNYVPSDAQEGNPQPRPITEADSARELYLYADSLPDNIDRNALEQITKGQCPGKCPPQLIAAAQYMLDHPESFDKMAPDGSVNKGELENNVAPLLNLHEDERAALDLLKSNPELFLKGEFITRESLLELANDKSASDEVRQAAATLHDSPVAFGMVDNAVLGHTNRGANDGKISAGDIAALELSKTNLTPPKVPVDTVAGANATALDALAENDMRDGMADDPETKKVRPSNTRLGRVLGVLSKVLDAVKTGLDAVAGFLPPPLSGIVAGISAGVSAVNNFGVKGGLAMLNGVPRQEAMKQGAKNFAFDAAASAASVIPGAGAAVKGAVMGAKQAVIAGVKEGAEAGVREGVEGGVKQGFKEGVENRVNQGVQEGVENRVKQGVQEGVETGAARGASKVGKEGVEEGAEAGAKASVKEELKETAADTVKEELTFQLQTAVTDKTGFEFGQSSEAGDGDGGGGRRGRGAVRSDRGSDEERPVQTKSVDKADKTDQADKTDPKSEKEAEREAERARQEEAAAAQQQVDLLALQSMMLMAGVALGDAKGPADKRPQAQTAPMASE